MAKALRYLLSLSVIALIVTGLTGLSHHLFREGGWLDTAAGSAWNAAMQSPEMSLVLIGCAAVVAAVCWGKRRGRRDHDRTATAVLYAMIAAGVYFTSRLMAVGTF